MPILDTLKSTIVKWFGLSPQPEERTGLQRPVTREMEVWDKESLRFDRQTKIKKCQEMQRADARIGRIYRKLASDASIGGVSVIVQSATDDRLKETAQEIIDETLTRCKINTLLTGWIRGCLRDGDLFLEISVDEKEQEITRVKKLAASITFSNMNSEGNFPDGDIAYYQEHPWTREKIKTFEAWQLVQISCDPEDGQPYGEPLLGAGRLSYDRLDNAEKNLVVRRALRAGQRKHHKIGTPERPGTWADVEEYKKRNRDMLSNPLDAVQDYFSNGNVDIDVLGGDDTLGELEDVRHFEGLLPMLAGIPLALMSGGREEAINRDVLEQQEQDYYRVIDDINDQFEHGLRKILDFALLLKGINPDAIRYDFNWGAKDREEENARIERAIKLQQLGFSFETIFSVCDLDKVSLDEETDRIRKQVEEGVIPYGINIKAQTDFLSALGVLSKSNTKDELAEQVSGLREAITGYLNGNGHRTRTAPRV